MLNGAKFSLTKIHEMQITTIQVCSFPCSFMEKFRM